MGVSPDAVGIGGRFRVACLLQAIIHCKPDRVFLFRDFNERPEYHAVLRHVDVLTRVDGLGVLRAKRQVDGTAVRSEEHTSELQSLMRISYAVFCLKKKTI